MYSIYFLSEPNGEDVRYVGFTKLPIQKRLTKHIFEKGNTKKNNWIKRLRNDGLRPIVGLIDADVDRDGAIKKEIYYIDLFKSIGADLVNGTNGGDGVVMTNEVREKIRAANRKRPPMSEYHRQKIVEANTGRIPWNKGIKTGRPSWSSGRTMSRESKEKLSKLKKGVPLLKARGKIRTEEHRKKLSMALKGRKSWNSGLKGICGGFTGKHSEETKRKMSLVKMGKILTKEHKDKIANSMRAYGAKRAAATLLLTTANYPSAQAVASTEGQP